MNHRTLAMYAIVAFTGALLLTATPSEGMAFAGLSFFGSIATHKWLGRSE